MCKKCFSSAKKINLNDNKSTGKGSAPSSGGSAGASVLVTWVRIFLVRKAENSRKGKKKITPLEHGGNCKGNGSLFTIIK